MKDTANQEKNKETMTGIKKVGKGRRQMADFREAVCCPSAVLQGQHGKKWFEGSVWGNWDPWEGQQPF